jgi:hypothetical protein
MIDSLGHHGLAGVAGFDTLSLPEGCRTPGSGRACFVDSMIELKLFARVIIKALVAHTAIPVSWCAHRIKKRYAAMTSVEWQSTMTELVDGIAANLCASTPAIARRRLREFRKQATVARTRAQQKQFEHAFESFVELKPYLRASVRRYLSPRIVALLTEANELLSKAAVVLKTYKQRKKERKEHLRN